MYNKFTRKVINQVTAKLNELFHTNIYRRDRQTDRRTNRQTPFEIKQQIRLNHKKINKNFILKKKYIYAKDVVKPETTTKPTFGTIFPITCR